MSTSRIAPGPRPQPQTTRTQDAQGPQQTGTPPAATQTQAPQAPAAPATPAAPQETPRTATAQSAQEANTRQARDVSAQQRQAQVQGTQEAGPGRVIQAPSLDDAAAGRSVLQRGHQGPNVTELQQQLNAAGADPPVREDGIFGRETERSVKQLQESRGITVDGKVGPETMQALRAPTSENIAHDERFQRLPEATQRDVRARLDAAPDDAARRNIGQLATNPDFGSLSPAHQQQMLAAQGAAPSDAGLTRDLTQFAGNPAARRLNSATFSEAVRHMGTADAAARQNVTSLSTSTGFGQLNPAHQRQALDAQARAPGDAQLTQDLTRLADSAQFRNLNDSVKTNALEEIARHPTDPAARQTISTLVQSPGFGGLSDADKNRMLNYTGGTNPLSQHVRPQLQSLLSSPAYTGANAAGQTQQLQQFMQNNNVPPGLVANLPASALPQRPYTVHGPTAVANHPFNSGAANAQRYDVEIDGRRIPVFMPQPAPANTHSVDQVAQSLASLPAASRASVTQVNVNPGANPADAHWAQVYGRPGFRSYMTAGSAGTVDIYPSVGTPPNQTQMAESMIHETGHVLSNRQWGDSANDPRWNRWRTAAQSDGVSASNYATASPQEDFAETLVLYQRVRGTPQEAEVRAMMPERFRIMDTMGL